MWTSRGRVRGRGLWLSFARRHLSVDVSHFETSSGVGMLIFTCRGHPHDAVPAPTLHNPRNLVSVVDNGPHPRGPCRCVAAAPPTRCTRAGGPNVWAMGPPAGCYHKWPRPGTQDVGHLWCSGGLERWVCLFVLSRWAF